MRRRLAAWIGIAAVLTSCGRRLDLPQEPDATGIPAGEVAYVKKYTWNGVRPLADVVLTSGQILYGVEDSTRVVAYFSDTASPRENTARSLPPPGQYAGQDLGKPVQICEGAENTLWVAYVAPFPILVQFDIATATRLASGVVRDLLMRDIGGIAADPDSGYVYVADPISNTIVKYAPSATGGRRVAVLATEGSGDGFVQQPHGLFFFQDSLLVADSGKGWLQVLSADVPRSGRGQVRGLESAPLALRDPRDVWVDATGFFYVADSDNDRVLKLARSGAIREVVTELDPESAVRPRTMTASQTLVWVADPGRERLTIYQINTITEELP